MATIRRTVALAIACWAGSGSPRPAAALLKEVDLPYLVSGARRVIVGEVVAIEPRWENGLIFSYVTLRPEEDLLGALPSQAVMFRNIGGQIGDRGLIVPDAPRFTVGERVVVFLGPESPGMETDVVGWSFGKYSVREGQVVEKGVPWESFRREILTVVGRVRR